MESEIWIANNHGGYLLKREILEYVQSNAIQYRDCGSDSEEIVRYPYYAAEVARAVSNGRIQRGILICSTGIGRSIVANRFPKETGV